MKKIQVANAAVQVLHTEQKIARNGTKYVLVHAVISMEIEGKPLEQVRRFTFFDQDTAEKP